MSDEDALRAGGADVVPAADGPADGSPTTARVLIVPCSGIGKALGSVGREAAYVVTQDLRPGLAGTLCLSLLTMGDARGQEMVRALPTITIDGCPKACAKVNVERSGGTPAAAYRVFDVFRAHKELRVDSVSDIGENGRRLAQVLAEEVAARVDELLAGEE